MLRRWIATFRRRRPQVIDSLKRSAVRVRVPPPALGRRSRHVHDKFAASRADDHDLGLLEPVVALTVDLSARHVDAVAGLCVKGRLATWATLQLHFAPDDVDHRFVCPVVVPAREPAGLGEYDPCPKVGGTESLLADHPSRLSGLAMSIARPNDAGLLLGRSLLLLGLPALVLDVKLGSAPRDPVPNALARRGIRRQPDSVAIANGGP